MAILGRPAFTIPSAEGLRVGVVVAQWHSDITEQLLERATWAAAKARAQIPTIIRVPGAMEIPVAAQTLAAYHDAVVALAVVLKGETAHFEYVCQTANTGLARVSLDASVPVGNGVLTCNSIEQAIARAGGPGAAEDKGAESMVAALQTTLILRELRSRPQGEGQNRPHEPRWTPHEPRWGNA